MVRASAEAVVGLVPGTVQSAVSVLRHEGVQVSAATGPGAASCEAWQLARRSGPAATAAARPGIVVIVDDLVDDRRWTHLRALALRDGLTSVLSVSAALPASLRTVVLSCYGAGRGALVAADATRVALLTAAHVSVALDRAVHENHLYDALGRRGAVAPGGRGDDRPGHDDAPRAAGPAHGPPPERVCRVSWSRPGDAEMTSA